MNPIEQIQDSLKSLSKIKQEFLETLSESHKQTIVGFNSIFGDVVDCYNKVEQLNKERQDYIELHCLPNSSISLQQHEQYHRVNEKLITQARSYYTIYKTCLNSLSFLIKSIIPESNRRGLRTKSFGSLVRSAKEFRSDNEQLVALSNLLNTLGEQIDKVCQYRDKRIEHPTSLSKGTLKTSGETTQLIHQQFSGHQPTSFVDDTKIPTSSIYLSRLQISASETEYLYYYHVLANQDAPDQIAKGESIGVVHDETNIHFQRYGSHMHIFSSQDLDYNIEDDNYIKNPIVETSPSPRQAMLQLTELINSIFKQLDDYNKVH